MDTSGESLVSIIGQLVVLALFVNAGVRMLPSIRRFPWPALVLAVIIGVPSLLQFALPGLTDALARDPDATLRHGQWWRILTALLVQDGGPVAAVFNLVVVALALTLGTWIWGPWLAVALYLVPSIVLNLLAVAWGQSGGGSSFANDGLMFSVFALGLLIGTRDAARASQASTISVRVCGAIGVLVAIVLVATGDAHGVAMLFGLVLGAAATPFAPSAGRRARDAGRTTAPRTST
ncbi:rhomboid family intramembrane serine protease [Humibacter ginsenosidimutans]|uniref:Rhomboid family intramembrane serine protease n=1 Tax=Humibacter ginsenosidimutans TaxID=2599293 RepID=A0A5B8M8G7_9MICO|nr:rhomboid family intramembrane serine protease [Humibacter ginsenosidimutans]QDZ15902.1 rhomboid family intramembrane serine protease [Humibacter ginsenosidimutans]